MLFKSFQRAFVDRAIRARYLSVHYTANKNPSGGVAER
jgi:hypothetical protein